MKANGNSRADAWQPLYVQYGCGLSCPEGWLNFDVSPRLRLERMLVAGALMRLSGHNLFPRNVRYGDIVKGLPVPICSAAGVYCSHVLEHIDRASVVRALENTLLILKPDGVFRLVVPDLTWRARKFLEAHDNGDKAGADVFMRTTYLGVEQPFSGALGRLRLLFGNSAHRWMYDVALMSSLLKDAGFVSIRRCTFGDAKDPMFAKVEDEGRFFDTGHAELALEAKRPVEL